MTLHTVIDRNTLLVPRILGAVLVLMTATLVARAALAQPNPPPAAFEACDGLDEGDACEVRFDGRRLAGRCVPMDSRLVCRPDHFPY